MSYDDIKIYNPAAEHQIKKIIAVSVSLKWSKDGCFKFIMKKLPKLIDYLEKEELLQRNISRLLNVMTKNERSYIIKVLECIERKVKHINNNEPKSE